MTFLGDLAADGAGRRADRLRATPTASATAGFDGAGPRFTAFSLPSAAAAALTFSAAADDNWSGPPSISWLFGDGTGASGATVSHAYGGRRHVHGDRDRDRCGRQRDRSSPGRSP